MKAAALPVPTLSPTQYKMPLAPAHQVFLPKEHGSWSLALEPIVFGLLVAPSLAGGALALSATAAFFMRRPLKSCLKHQDRPSALALFILILCALVGFTELILLGDSKALWPLLPTLPLGLLYLHWDRQNEGRATAAELTGVSLFALLPATMATVSGQPGSVAVVLTVLMLARSAPAVLTVRCWLRQRKGQPTPITPAVLTTLAFLILVTALARYDSVPMIAVGMLTLASLRLFLLSPKSPNWPARRVGTFEAIFGVVYITIVAATLRF